MEIQQNELLEKNEINEKKLILEKKEIIIENKINEKKIIFEDDLISGLPNELLIKILSFCDFYDLMKFCLTCKQIFDLFFLLPEKFGCKNFKKNYEEKISKKKKNRKKFDTSNLPFLNNLTNYYLPQHNEKPIKSKTDKDSNW
jgi:hypothetical protein